MQSVKVQRRGANGTRVPSRVSPVEEIELHSESLSRAEAELRLTVRRFGTLTGSKLA